MSNHDELADSIIDLVWRVLKRKDAPVAKFYMAIWQNANAGDALLSDIILVDGSPVKGVPKLGTLSFSANDPLIVGKAPGVPLTILGIVKGDITLAQ